MTRPYRRGPIAEGLVAAGGRRADYLRAWRRLNPDRVERHKARARAWNRALQQLRRRHLAEFQKLYRAELAEFTEMEAVLSDAEETVA